MNKGQLMNDSRYNMQVDITQQFIMNPSGREDTYLFDVRKIQENTIFHAVKRHSDATTANEIVYGANEKAKTKRMLIV